MVKDTIDDAAKKIVQVRERGRTIRTIATFLIVVLGFGDIGYLIYDKLTEQIKDNRAAIKKEDKDDSKQLTKLRRVLLRLGELDKRQIEQNRAVLLALRALALLLGVDPGSLESLPAFALPDNEHSSRGSPTRPRESPGPPDESPGPSPRPSPTRSPRPEPTCLPGVPPLPRICV